MNEGTFDWRTQTTRKGTVSRVGQWVRGDCAWDAGCAAKDVLVYDSYDDPTLLCADHSRIRATRNPRVEICDTCGGSPAWRDPVTGRNDFYCAQCHGKNGTVFQNRWSLKARESRVLGIHEKVKCDAADRGTGCKGEIKWRGGELNMLLCNKHAGKKSANEANN